MKGIVRICKVQLVVTLLLAKLGFHLLRMVVSPFLINQIDEFIHVFLQIFTWVAQLVSIYRC